MKYDKRHLIISLLFLLGIVSLLGCGKGRIPGLATCEGTVTWKGDPVEEAFVAFSPKDGGRSASGFTDAKGRFKVTTLDDNDGIMPGEYVVTITKITTTREGGIDESVEEREKGRRQRNAPEIITETHFIPQVYADRKTSGLSAVISSKGNRNLTFDLVGNITN